MSNKISNSVTFKCDTNRLNEILEAIQYTCDDNPEEYGIGTINFNKICPMPDSLNIEHGSRTWDAAKYYLTLINPSTPFLDVEKLSLDAFSNLYKQLPSHLLYGLASVDIVQLEERWSKEFLLERGRQAIENVQKYGADTWYEWRYEHWGTKWNAHNCYYDGFNTIHFQTANGAPFEVTQALSRRFPDVTMIHSWYGDYYTYCAGRKSFKDGKTETSLFYHYCDVDIKVPSCLGYQYDRYSLVFAPELDGVDRNDHTALVSYVLRSAIEDAEQAGTIPSGHITDEEFSHALEIALDDLATESECEDIDYSDCYDSYLQSDHRPEDASITHEIPPGLQGYTPAAECEDFPF